MSWLPATIFGFAFFPFLFGLAIFFLLLTAFSGESSYRMRDGHYYYYRKELSDSSYFIVGVVCTIIFSAMLIGEFSWEAFGNFGFLLLKWILVGMVWCVVRWLVEAHRGTKAFDHNKARLLRFYDNDESRIKEEEKVMLRSLLPSASYYKWRMFAWIIFWPMSFISTFFRDFLQVIWERIFAFFSGTFDRMAGWVYGDRRNY